MADRDERMIAALLRERDAYVRQDKPERVDQVDAELARHGYTPEAPATDPSTEPPQGRTAEDATQQTADTTPPPDTAISAAMAGALAAADVAAVNSAAEPQPEAPTEGAVEQPPAAAKKAALPRRSAKPKS